MKTSTGDFENRMAPHDHRGNWKLVAVFVVIVGAYLFFSLTEQRSTLPPDARRALQTATSATLYSLEPEDRGNKTAPQFHDFPVLGRTTLDPKQTAEATRAFRKALADSRGWIASCFEPRHALRINERGHVYDYVLCYQCMQLDVYRDDTFIAGLTAAGSPEVLNNLLTSLGVPLSRYYSPEAMAEREAKRRKDREGVERWRAAIPSSVRKLWNDEQMGSASPAPAEKFAASLAAEFPDTNTRILVLLTWYGSGAGPWSGYPSYESVPEDLLLKYPLGDLLAAIQSTNLTEPQTEGAARLFGSWEFRQQRKADLKLLPPELKKTLLDHSLKSVDEDKKGRAQTAFGEQSPEKASE